MATVLKFDRRVVVADVEADLPSIDRCVAGSVMFDVGYSTELRNASAEVVITSPTPWDINSVEARYTRDVLIAHARVEAMRESLKDFLSEKLADAERDRKDRLNLEKLKAQKADEAPTATLLVENQ
jgi:hypothetical protein